MDDDLGIDGVDPSVSFLYKTMFSRDPKKRRVKPVQKHLIQVDFGGLDDSEEDSDFELNSHKEGHNSDSGEEESDKGSKESSESKEVASEAENAEEGDEEEAAAEGEAESSEGDDNDDDNGDDDDSNDESNDESSSDNDEDADSSREEPAFNFFGDYDEDEDEDYVPKKKDKQKKAAIDTVVKLKLPEAKLPPVSETQLKVNHGHIKVLICCVCLSDTNADDDEIVECDNCGVSVHEGCYGISESQSAASTESSASTEPWFCDACKAGVKPHCELCPNFGGIYKETDAGKWVHLVCALYTPGVAFGDVDKLSPVTLFEMPYVRWGARECALCEDARFCRTGVCISCDAGMCRTYFHVTCAQREGLLSEASPEEDIADPFFAYCKLHADKNSARAKRRNWLAIQSHVRRHSDRVLEDEKEKVEHSVEYKARFHRKLNRHRQKYAIAKSRRPPSWVPTQKLVRFLTSSPSAVRRMLKKAELMGVITQVHNSSHGHEKQETRKKLHIAPALTSDFIGYYLERNARIENLKQNMKDLITQNDKLKDQEKILRSQYDQLFAALEKHKESTTRLRKEGEMMWDNLSESGGKKVNIPEMFRPKKAPRSPTKKETPKSPPAVIHKCGICVLTTDQHLLAKCDSCKKHYHLGCLDPPLTRMPKKTKLQGWQCSECVSSSSDESVEKSNVNVDAPRRLRETIKQPQKFVNMQRLEMLKKEKRNKSKNVKRSSSSSSSSSRKKKTVEQEKQEEEVESVPTPTPAPDPDPEPEPELELEEPEPEPESEQEPALEPPPKKPKMTPTSSAPKKPKPTKEDEHRNVCVVCNQPGSNSNLVSCDECQLCYHFQCLNPPTRKSPKPRGYTWHCEACDPTDESEMDDDDEDEGTVEGEVHTRPSSPEEVMEHVEIVNLGDEDADVDVEEEDDVVQIDDSD